MEEIKMKKVIAICIFSMFAFALHAQKFAYVDTDYILENVTEYVTAQEELDELAVEWQKEIEAKFAEIDKMYKDYRAEAVLLPDDMKQKREDEIVEKEKEAKELQKKRFGKDGDLFKKREELIKPIQDKIYEAIEKISEEKGYAIVFDKASGSNMLFTDPRFDLSDDVIESLGYRPGGN